VEDVYRTVAGRKPGSATEAARVRVSDRFFAWVEWRIGVGDFLPGDSQAGHPWRRGGPEEVHVLRREAVGGVGKIGGAVLEAGGLAAQVSLYR
jgi:hypothetical protein